MRQQDVLGGVSTTCKAQGGCWSGGRGPWELLVRHWVRSWGPLPFLGDRRSHGRVLRRELMACLWLCNSLLVAKSGKRVRAGVEV